MDEKDGMADNRNSKHVKVIPMISEQYLRDQLSKINKAHKLEDIVRQFEIQIQQDKGWTYTEAILRHQQITQKLVQQFVRNNQ